ncbi:MAG: sulfotransferase [Pseudomonadota bacterium]
MQRVPRVFEEPYLAARRIKHRLACDLRRWVLRARGIKKSKKVFCIGRGKTGTTSMYAALSHLGYLMGNELEAALIYDAHYHNGEFGELIEYCKKYDAFQDLPFGAVGTFKVMDRAFPGSKFILTIRDSSEQWYKSAIGFQSKRMGTKGIPTYEDIAKFNYIRTGYSLHLLKLNQTTKDDPFNKEKLIRKYETHNRDVMDYFADRPDDLLVLNVAEPGAMQKLAAFLGEETTRTEFPWKNKT